MQKAHFKTLAEPFGPKKVLKLKGLDPNRNYAVEGSGVCGGDRLMHAGLAIQPLKGDYASAVFRVKAAD